MSGFAYYNGKYDRKESICVPLTDRSLFFGDAVYDMAIGKGGKIYQCDNHVSRILNNAAALGINHSLTHDCLSEILHDCTSRSEYEEYTVYFQISRASEKRVHSALCTDYSLLIIVDEFKFSSPVDNLKLITYEDRRYQYCNIKTVNLLPSVMASTRAEEYGCDEALFHRGETVTECSHSNVFIIKDKTLITHPNCELILPGITAENLILSAMEHGIKVLRRPFTLRDVYLSDEIIITSTTRFARSVSSLNGVSVGGKDKNLANELCYSVYHSFCKKMEI